MEETFKGKAIKGVMWSGVDTVSTYLVTFAVNIIMARLLTPADYGIVGFIAVFISFSQVFIDGGFSTALIAKSTRDDKDYTTVYVFNVCSALCLYVLLFFAAPLIETFFNQVQLGVIIRVYCLMLILSSFSAIQITRLTINVDFKTISKINVPSVIFSGVVGILLAYMGYGVWAIVGQQLLYAFLRIVLALYYTRWLPKARFSKDRFIILFSFSSKLILSSLVDRIYTNSFPLFIGKFFTPATLGNYTRGHQFGSLPAGIMGSIFTRVTFPLISRIQDDDVKLVNIYRQYIKLSSFVIFPIMMLVVVMAEPLVKVVLTDKWLGCVPFMQILSMAMMLDHVGSLNRNLLYVKKHSDWALRLEIIKKMIAISIFLLSTLWGIWGVVIGQWVYGMIAPSLNSYYTKRLIGLSLREQFCDYFGIWVISVVTAVIPFFLVTHINSIHLQLFISFTSYSMSYLILCWLCRIEALDYVVKVVRAYIC